MKQLLFSWFLFRIASKDNKPAIIFEFLYHSGILLDVQLGILHSGTSHNFAGTGYRYY